MDRCYVTGNPCGTDTIATGMNLGTGLPDCPGGVCKRRREFWYLATPYSKYPHGIDAAFRVACTAAADLISAGVRVYSPIAHTHPIAMIGRIDPLSHDIWLPADEPFMHAARGLIVLRAEGWETSYGISEEIKAFAAAGKPIVYMDPGAAPVEISEVR